MVQRFQRTLYLFLLLSKSSYSPTDTMPPPKGKVWQYFEKTLEGAVLCKKSVTSRGGNTANLAAHLSSEHNIEVSAPPSAAGLFKKVATTTNVLETYGGKSTSTTTPNLPHLPLTSETGEPMEVHSETKEESTPVSAATIFDRARLVKLSPAKQHRVSKNIAAYLVKDMRPFSTVESKHFREMIHVCDERVVIPNKDEFSQRIIPSWYDLEVAQLMEELKAVQHVALTSDCWTSRTTVPYMTITAHYFDKDFSMQARVLQTRVLVEPHIGENISVALNHALECWQIQDKVSVITTDNNSNMGVAVWNTDIGLKIGCFAHRLDLAAKKAVDVMKPITSKMKRVIAFIHGSDVGSNVFTEKQEALPTPIHKLIMDVETQWNSTYLMYERYFEQRVAIHEAFMDYRLASHRGTYSFFKESEVLKAEEFITTMKNFYDMTVNLCSESTPTASIVLPLF